MTDEAMVELNKAAECHQCGGTGSIQTAYDGPPTFGFEPCPRCAGTDEAMVEELARIIDPSSWAVMDGYLKDMLRKYKGENAAYDPDAFKHKASMTTARAVLASPTFTRLIAERDGAYERGWRDGMNEAADITDRWNTGIGTAIRNLNRSADGAK